MNKKVIFVFGLVVIFGLLPVSGYGSYITMGMQTTITASPEKIEVVIKVQNKGDDPLPLVKRYGSTGWNHSQPLY